MVGQPTRRARDNPPYLLCASLTNETKQAAKVGTNELITECHIKIYLSNGFNKRASL
jgi:hypothetical protein